MSKLGQNLSQYWFKIQESLFPDLEEELDPLTQKQQQLITILEIIRIEEFIPSCQGKEGRPKKDRSAIARSFVAKMVYNITTTRFLWDRLHSDKNLRRSCGWENKRQIPSESTFSRAMTDFANTELPQKVHENLIKKAYEETKTIILHNSIDATAIEARENGLKKVIPITENESKPKNKGGRPKKGEKKPEKEPESRIEKQQTMSLQ